MSDPQQPRAHQRVSWLELFYDLVYVVVIERLTHLLHGDPSGRHIAVVLGLTLIVWLAWFNVTSLTNISGELPLWGRLSIFVSMAGVGVLGLGLEGITEGHAWLFVLGFTIARTACWPLWLWARRGSGVSWLRLIIFGPVVGVGWLLTPLLPTDWLGRALIVLCVLELSVSLLRPDRRGAAPELRINGPHMVERIGIFVMIVLGSSVFQIVNSLDGSPTIGQWVTGALAMALLCALWSLVYEATMSKTEEAVEHTSADVVDFIGGSQFAIVAGLICVAAGLAGAIEGAPHHHFEPGALACLGLGMLLVSIGVGALSARAWSATLGVLLDRRGGSAIRAFLGSLPILALWWFGAELAPWLLLAIFTAYVALASWRQYVGEQRVRAHLAAGGDLSDLFERPRRGR